MPTRPVPRQGDSAPLIIVAGIAAAALASWLRYPGVPLVWVAFVLAASFSAPPQYTGPKDASGQPSARGSEASRMLRYRRWALLRRDMAPSASWLPSTTPSQLGAPTIPAVGTFLSRFPFLGPVVTGVRFLLPSRTATLAGLGAASSVATLPVDSLPVHLWWLNAAAAYICVCGWDDAYRRSVATEDVAPPVSARDVAAVVSDSATRAGSVRALVLAGILGAGASYAVFAALRITELTWLIVPAWLAATGIGVLVVAAVVHAGFRASVIAKHKRMVQVRAAWAPRWAGLKEDVRLVEHEDLPGGGTVDVFDAPATLGAMGAFALTAKLVPLLGSGVTFGILPQANQDAEGQPIPGSIHPVRFRVVTFPLGSEPRVTDPEANPQELGLLAEVWAANGVRAGGNGQQAEVPQLRELTKATTPESVALVWQAHFHNPVFLGDAADGIQAGSGAPGAIPLDDSILFGELEDAARCTFVDKNLSEVLAKMVWDRDWRKRWRDVFKSKEGKMVATPQYAAKSQAILALPGGDVTLRYAPMMTRQGDKIADYMRPDIARQVATTLRGAPFCTVTWYPSRFARGERDEVAFAVIHADKEVPKDPSRIPVGASRQAALWALTRGVNEAFDAAKLPRPFVVNVHPMTTPRSAGAIWRVNLRLYDGVTLDLVKRAAVKMKGAIGSPAWLIVTGGESGATMFVGAHPAAPGVTFTTRDAENQCQVADLENAFTEAGLDSPFDGSTPQRLEVGQLPSNDQVTRMVFTVPTRRAVSDFRESKALEKVKAATGYQFFDVRTMPDPAQFEVLASRIDPMPTPAPFHWDTVTEEGYRMVPFGSRVEGNPCVWDLGLDSHVLVLGSNGSGKGIAMTAMLAPMLIHGWNVYSADPIKGFNDFGFADPWLYSRCTTYEQTAAMMKHIIGILEERRQLNAEHGVSNVRDLPDDLRPPMVGVFIDEFTSLVIPDPVKKPAEGADQMALETYAQTLQVNTAKEVIAAAVGRVVREGRATGVAMVVAGQKLTSDIMSRIPGGSTIKSQFSRLAMGKMSFGDMASAFNDAQSAMGLLGPAVPRGRGIFESTSEAAFAVQTWWGGGSQAEHFAQIVEHVSSVRPPLRDDERQDFTFADEQAQTAAPVFGRVKGETSSTPPPPSVAVPLLIDDDEIVAVIDGDGLGLDFGSEEDDTIEEVVIVEGEGLGLTFDDEPAPLITSTPALIPPLRVLAEPVEANSSPPDPMDLFPGVPTPIRIDSDVRFD